MGFSLLYTPEYLQQTPTGLFFFRLRAAKDCQPDIGKKELKYSLKTRSLRKARKITASILSFLTGIFNGIRQRAFEGHGKDIVNQSILEGIKRAIVNDSPPYAICRQRGIMPPSCSIRLTVIPLTRKPWGIELLPYDLRKMADLPTEP